MSETGYETTPEFMDWIKAYETAVAVARGVFREVGLSHEAADHNARAIFARLASHDPPLAVEWLRDDEP